MADEQRNLESLFLAALEIESPEQRAAFLDTSCGEDVSLRNEVERLLRSHEQAGSFLESPAPELAATILMDQERAASLEAGLAAAFPAEAAVVMGAASHSVLQSLGKTIELPRVVLREAPEGADPIVRTSAESRNSDSRYQLHGEIARGGMGAIIKGRDTDLQRDLAIKVLLEEHKEKPDVIQRFIEEAQIGGQLQHPGIAPVYELGQFADRRPFFSMKLVKGQTLARLLADRTDASADRGKLLGIFKQVCDTMAYAHSRGVIHRDLKPANVMVGAFGEVQVMDWGLAKVLPVGGVADEKKSRDVQHGLSYIQTLRSTPGSDPPGSSGSVGSQTQMGCVMGTPAYMPPEQALGEIDLLDERADVFGLGAILCEILTGQPPYTGTDSTAVFRQASRGKLADCLARLDACGAEAELIVLTRHCLELEPKDRPRDATVLAARVSGYLQSVEVRLRESELAKVDAQVRAEELRRRHKLAFTAGAAIAASLVAGLTVSIWQAVRAENEAARARSQEQRVLAVLDELRDTAPAFAEQARSLAAKEQFGAAIEKLDYAVKLRPDVAEYLVAKGDLLQCQLKLAEAAAIYRAALRVQPGLARAEASAKLCDELLAAKPGEDGQLTRESLAKLYRALQRQQRPATELMPVARLLGEKKLLVDYWLARLKDLPVSPERPLKDRLTVGEDGRLALDLGGTQVLDLTSLSGAPLSVLKLMNCTELNDITPLRGLSLIELDVGATSVADLGPLREMQTLENLDVSRSRVSDLAALGGLHLKSLKCRGCPISDLSPLRQMPLELIDLLDTRVADLSPLMGMPIRSIDLSRAPVVDFSPLAQLPLESCYLQFNRITDLSVLRGRPLKELCLWGCTEARNYTVLKEIQTLEILQLPESYRNLPAKDYEAIAALRDHPRLRQIGAEIINKMGYQATGSKEVFWKDWDREQAIFSALRKNGIRFTARKQPGGTYVLDVFDQPLHDLSILKGLPIVELDVHRCPFVDLMPLRDLPLKKLSLVSNSVTDFSPLHGMSVERLYLNNCPNLSDLSPLIGLPLREVYLDQCKNLTDVAALAEIPTLELVTAPIHARNVDALRKLPNLKRLGYEMFNGIPDSTAAEFWEHHGWVSKLHESGIRPQAVRRLENGLFDVSLAPGNLSDLTPLQGLPIEILSCGATKVTDLSPIRGIPIKRLRLWHTPVADLEPLRGMPLKELNLRGTRVTDLSPLEGMPLEQLELARTTVADISVLRGMPLIEAKFGHCTALTDLSVLVESKDLQTVTLPPNAKNFEFLRDFPKLEFLSFTEKDPGTHFRPDKTAAEFWQEYDAKKE